MQCNCFIIMLLNIRFLIKDAMESKYILIILSGNNKNKKALFEYFIRAWPEYVFEEYLIVLE